MTHYATAGSSYTKAESDGRYKTKRYQRVGLIWKGNAGQGQSIKFYENILGAYLTIKNTWNWNVQFVVVPSLNYGILFRELEVIIFISL